MSHVTEEKARGKDWNREVLPESSRRVDGPLPELPAWAVEWIADASKERAPREEERQALFEQLGERKLVQWLLAYAAVAWMLLQLVEVLNEIWGWPIVLLKALSLSLGLAILPVTVIAWYHGEEGRQEVCRLEALIVGVLALATALLVWLFLQGGLA